MKYTLLLTLLFSALIVNEAFSQDSSQIFTSSGSFTVPSSVSSVTIEVVGAGGTGGGNGGGGGGGGGYALGTYSVEAGTSIIVIVGSGGGGGAAGTTTVGNLISATGGENGFSVSNPNLGGGGTGGTGTGGTIANYTGGTGGGGYWTYFGGGGAGAAGSSGNGLNGGNTILWVGNCITPGGAAGLSGGSPGGDGGKGAGFTDAFCNVSDPAADGVNYGGGGGGGNGNGGVPGEGAGGYCKISWGVATSVNDELENNHSKTFTTLVDGKIIVQNIDENADCELINSMGQLIWAGDHVGRRDFSGLPSDLYLLKVQGQSYIWTYKLIKQ